MPIATLGMYDWPEVHGATDALWAAMRDALKGAGFAAPEHLSRGGDPMAMWQARDLIVGQTCGYPYATRLAGTVCLLGTPAYAIDCAPGDYFSVVVARKADAGRPLSDLSRMPFAFNTADSQSGFHAPMRMFAALHLAMPETQVETGAHRASIRAVADGEAGFAAIDAVTWELALRHEPAAGALSVMVRTPPTRGLPLIAGAGYRRRLGALRRAVTNGIASLDAASRDALLIKALTPSSPEDYAPLAAPIEGISGPSA